MNKKRKINIFILAIFFIISSIISAHFSPEKEIKTIQTLPRKPQANLDIEVTKVKSQEITGQIDEKSKVITVDFSELLNSRKNKMNIDKSQYEIYPIENLENLQYPKSKFMRSNLNQNKFQVTKSDTSININYEEKPEKLYLAVFNQNTSNVEKVFKLNLEKYILPRVSIGKTYTLTNPIFIRSGNTSVNVEGISNTQGIYIFGLTATGTFYAQGTSSYGYSVDSPFQINGPQGLSLFAGTPGSSDSQPVSSTLNASSGGQSSTVFIYYPTSAGTRDWNRFAIYNNNTSGLNSGNTRTNTSLLRYLNGDSSTIVRFVVFGAWGQSTYRAGFEILKWDLNATTFNFRNIYTHDITWTINLPALDVKGYYDNTNATIQSSGSTITKNGTFLDFRGGILLGTVKLRDGSVVPNLATDPHGGVRFVGNANVTLSNGTKTMNGTIYTTPVGTDPTGVNSNPYFSGTGARSALNVYFKLNNTTNLETGLAYASSNNRLLKLEVVNKPSFLTELITNLNLTINRIDKAATITLKNPVPKRNGTTSGYYNLTGATSPSGMSTNQSTLSWTGSPISTDYGYSLYNFTHKVVVRFTDGANIGRVVFDTDVNGKITGTTKYQTVSVGGNTYTIGDFGDGKFSLGMDQWNFANKTGIKIDILHYDNSYTNPASATDNQAFAKDTFTLNIETLTPETYYKVDGSDSNLIVKNGSRTLNIPKVSNPSILIGKVQLKNDDKTITIDTNTTPTNPNGITFATTGQTLTFSNGTNTVTGTVSIDNSPSNDTTGRNLYLNLTSGVIFSGANYTLSNATLIKLGIKSTTNNPTNPSDIYYNLINNLTLVPGGLTFDKSSSFTFRNPIPKGLSNGTGSYILNGATNPTGISTNQNTLVWATNNAPTSGMTLSPITHKIGVWITDSGNTQKVSFTTDATGKLSGTKTGTISIGGNTYIFGDFNSDGNFSLGLQNWNFTNKSGIIVKILHFDNTLDPLTASEAQAFGRDQFTMNIDVLNPEIYYKVDPNDSELIVKDGVQNLKIPRSGEGKISLGKVKVKNSSEVDKGLLTNFTFYQTGEILTFIGTDSTTISGTIELSPEGADETGRELILNITNGTPTPGITYTATPILIKLGTNDSGGIYYNLRNTLNLELNDSFVADYSVDDLDFGAAIANNKAYNEAKTTLNLTLADDIVNPTLSYAIKTSPTTTNNYYTNFKLHPNGVEISDDFVTTDIWLGNEVKDNNNLQKRSIDINGKINDISNAQIGTSTKLYQNIVEIEIKLQ
ncbi:hypothetical protein [Cetobacterium sp. 2G large]|uniref:hypothetical protein n=1 Tax=Cetobacterium sp. 2G large TaxID=2759680 RepID=UPI00163C8560|nr:hypothetical protein [Cetobacterium sp. 2G large]MBC2853647.1 hypothetical protein [Cetobacterium sp. 2G large]